MNCFDEFASCTGERMDDTTFDDASFKLAAALLRSLCNCLQKYCSALLPLNKNYLPITLACLRKLVQVEHLSHIINVAYRFIDISLPG
ncbi:hypothetical protein ALC53_04204 [Atta colombica]|uniref:Uncharacterized protein n=1 Tax=Atta colombica TaxID=520822 RepID=A0A195BL34_9HYME|nr:hypothetical protein ALC53_04204 [Atta colombica]